MAYADRVAGSTRLTTIAAVAAIHGLIGFVFVTGMATNFVREFVPILTIRNIPADPPPQPQPVPPLEKASAQPSQPTVITTVTPIVPSTATNTELPTLPLPPLPPMPLDPVLVTPPPPLPPVSRAVKVSARGSRAGWITTDDYPPSAIRAGEEGVVGIALQVGADGRPQSCSVTVPSGHASLDQATCRLYQRRARFAPARDDAGNAMAATYTDRVRWVLPM